MNCKTANTEISLLDILYKQGFKESYSRKSNGNTYVWFLSPFRDEKTASFSINTITNTYYDFGSGEYGRVVDYMTKYYQCSIAEALGKLKTFNFSSFPKQKVEHSALLNKEELNYKIIEVKHIQTPNLKKYLNRRKIHEPYWKYLVEVHFKLRDKVYYAVGFENDSQGYELSWEYWNKAKQDFVRHKMCLVVKDVTFIRKGLSGVVILESWSDFLALLSLYPNMEKNDFIILNSVSTKEKSFKLLEANQYQTIYSATDNDDAGRVYLEQLLQKFADKVIPLNEFYRGFKDIGEFWESKGMALKR